MNRHGMIPDPGAGPHPEYAPTAPRSVRLHHPFFHSDSGEEGQLVLAGGVSLAFAVLIIAGLTGLGFEMEAGRDVEPSLGPEFSHLGAQFEEAVSHWYGASNDSAEEAFRSCAVLFSTMQLQYGLNLDLRIQNITGTPGNETLVYRMELLTARQYLGKEGIIHLVR